MAQDPPIPDRTTAQGDARRRATPPGVAALGAGALRGTPPGVSSADLGLSAAVLLSGLRVLVVDDEPDVRRVVAKRIARFGAHVETASDGVEATALVLGDGPAFDLIVTDQTMPRRAGDEFVRLVREAGNRTPAVIMSGFTASGAPHETGASGAQAFLSKPFDSAQLLAALVASLGRRSDAAPEAASGAAPPASRLG